MKLVVTAKSIRFKGSALLLGASYLIVSILVELVGEDFFPNRQLFLIINGAQNSFLNWFILAVTNYGQAYFWIPIVLLLWILGREEHKRTAVLMSATLLLATILGQVSKVIFDLPRPSTVLLEARVLVSADGSSAFPSGHAVLVSAGAAVALRRLPRSIATPLTLEALLVSYSRVYVGVHWPIDVLGGWLLGGFCAVLILSESSRLEPLYELLLRKWNDVTSYLRRFRGNRLLTGNGLQIGESLDYLSPDARFWHRSARRICSSPS